MNTIAISALVGAYVGTVVPYFIRRLSGTEPSLLPAIAGLAAGLTIGLFMVALAPLVMS